MPPSPPNCRLCAGARAGDCASRRVLRGAVRLAVVLAGLLQPVSATAQRVRITNLADVDFGLIANLQTESRRSQSVCVFSNSSGNAYSITASGSGPGGAFALTDGSNSLAYNVEWSPQSGQGSGTLLAANVALTGQTSAATHQFCNSGPPTSASLTIVLRAFDLSMARQGNYSGSLTLLIAAE